MGEREGGTKAPKADNLLQALIITHRRSESQESLLTSCWCLTTPTNVTTVHTTGRVGF